jgi:hypothetical protein
MDKTISILKVIFPDKIDNTFYGGKIPLFVFYIITAITIWRSQHHLFAPDSGAQSIATIPLNLFSESAQMAVIGSFALWGLSQLIIAFLYLLVCIKYKSLIPLMYLLLVFEYSMRAFYIGNFKPIPFEGTAPGAVGNLPTIFVSLTMLVIIMFHNLKEFNLRKK